MQKTTVIRRSLILLPLLYACAAPEGLIPKSAAVPAGVDLSGQWKIRPESLRGQPRINEAIDRTDGVDNRTIMREMKRGRPRNGETSGGLVHVFLETGESLTITQTPHALFVSFDRAIVEEYRFGENRPVSIGAADAHRVSGWEGGSYVIETLGEKGMKLTERYRLADNNDRLIRRITLRSKNLEEVTIVHEFNRQGG
ncbi:MAG: hypothetical protein ACE5OQ_01870 [Woeseia sp.]